MQPAQCFSGQDMQFDGNQRTIIRIKQSMKRYSPRQPVTDISPCIVDSGYLRILGVAIGNFTVARFHLVADMSEVQQILTRQPVHFEDKFVKVGRGDEILAMIDESLNRRRW